MKTIIKTAIVLVVMLLSVFCYGQDKATNYIENEFIIWLEQGVDASTFAAKSSGWNRALMPRPLPPIPMQVLRPSDYCHKD